MQSVLLHIQYENQQLASSGIWTQKMLRCPCAMVPQYIHYVRIQKPDFPGPDFRRILIFCVWISYIFSIWDLYYIFSKNSKCLKSELLKSELVWNPRLDFRHPYVSKNRTQSSVFKHILKNKIGTVWKPNSYWVSEIHTSS